MHSRQLQALHPDPDPDRHPRPAGSPPLPAVPTSAVATTDPGTIAGGPFKDFFSPLFFFFAFTIHKQLTSLIFFIKFIYLCDELSESDTLRLRNFVLVIPTREMSFPQKTALLCFLTSARTTDTFSAIPPLSRRVKIAARTLAFHALPLIYFRPQCFLVPDTARAFLVHLFSISHWNVSSLKTRPLGCSVYCFTSVPNNSGIWRSVSAQ